MLVIENETALRRALDSPINEAVRCILALRHAQQLSGARFIVVQPRDALYDIEAAAGFPIATSLVDGSRFPDSEFVPGWEWATAHAGAWEALYIFADDDRGTVLLMPQQDDLDPTLLAIVRAFADDAPAFTSPTTP